MKSILQRNTEECFLCHTTRDLHWHHVYEGSRRQASERHGFVVRLCARHHNMSDDSVHGNEELNRKLKRLCQRVYERTHTREEFMKIIHRNYL